MGLASVIRGHGPDIIALHGGPGLSHTYLRAPLKALEESYTIHYVDHLGHGASPREPPYSLASLARAVVAYAQKHAPDGSVILGHSMGGAVALTVASTSPDLVRGLVLVSAIVRAPSLILRGNPVVKARLARVIAMHVVRGDARELVVKDAVRILEPLLSEWPTRRARDALIASIVPPVDCLYPLLAEAARLRVMRLLPRIRVPARVIVGDGDVFGRGDAVALARRLPNASLHTVRGAGHHLILEHETDVTRDVRAFLANATPARGRGAVSRAFDDDVIHPRDRQGFGGHPATVGSHADLVEGEAVASARADRVGRRVDH